MPADEMITISPSAEPVAELGSVTTPMRATPAEVMDTDEANMKKWRISLGDETKTVRAKTMDEAIKKAEEKWPGRRVENIHEIQKLQGGGRRG